MSGVNDIRRTEVEREEGDERTRLSHERRKRERQEKWRGPWPLAPHIPVLSSLRSCLISYPSCSVSPARGRGFARSETT